MFLLPFNSLFNVEFNNLLRLSTNIMWDHGKFVVVTMFYMVYLFVNKKNTRVLYHDSLSTEVFVKHPFTHTHTHVNYCACHYLSIYKNVSTWFFCVFPYENMNNNKTFLWCGFGTGMNVKPIKITKPIINGFVLV